jgi:hypothetical protein
MVYTTALFSDTHVDIRSQTDEGGVDDAKSGTPLPAGIGLGEDMRKKGYY